MVITSATIYVFYKVIRILCIIIQGSGNLGANVKRLEQETEAKIHQLKTEAARVSHDIVHMLMNYATNVNNLQL